MLGLLVCIWLMVKFNPLCKVFNPTRLVSYRAINKRIELNNNIRFTHCLELTVDPRLALNFVAVFLSPTSGIMGVSL